VKPGRFISRLTVQSLRICSRYVLQEATSLAYGGSWALLYILLQEGLGAFV
jgi:hypothetical protein